MNVAPQAKGRVVHSTSAIMGMKRWDALAVAPCLGRRVVRCDYDWFHSDREMAGAAHRGDRFSEFGEAAAA